MASTKDNDDGTTTVRWREQSGARQRTVPHAEAPGILTYGQGMERAFKEVKAHALIQGADATSLKLIGCTIRTAGDDWLESLPNEGTRINNQYRLRKHLYPHVGSLIAERMQPRDVIALQAQWEKAGLASASRRQLFIHLKTIYSYLQNNRAIKAEDNPFARMKTPPKPKRITVAAWPDERIGEYAAAFAKRYSIYPELGSGLGLRQGEIFAAGPDDFVLRAGKRFYRVQHQVKVHANNKVVFAPPKHRRLEDDPREVPVPDWLWEGIEAYTALYPPQDVTMEFDPSTRAVRKPMTKPLLLVSREGKALNRNYFNGAFIKVALESCGIPATRENMTHALRHWFAASNLTKGVPVEEVSHWLGHASTAFTWEVYSRFVPDGGDTAKLAMESLGASLFRKP